MQHSDADPPGPAEQGTGTRLDAERGAQGASNDPISSGPVHRASALQQANPVGPGLEPADSGAEPVDRVMADGLQAAC